MREVLGWKRDFTDTPYEILRTHPDAAPGWVADLRKFCRGTAPETLSSTRISMGLILTALADDLARTSIGVPAMSLSHYPRPARSRVVE
jgi:hypothetical protein